MRILLCLVCLLFSVSSLSSNVVELKGLFGKKAALLMVDGKETVLKVGEGEHGVTLITILDREVIIDVGGRQRQVSLSKQRSAAYKEPQKNIVRLARQDGGHYWSQGQINNRSFRFVVDTGATTISMNLSTAKRLGIDYTKGNKARIATANGITEAYVVNLEKVTVGTITQYNIAATVMLDDALPVVLLGNSFLSGVDMRTENGVLILESQL